MKDFEFMMAPMEGISNSKFRDLVYNNGADSTFTEMARVSALNRANKSTVERIKIPKDIPTYIQLSVTKEKDLEKFLKDFKPEKGFLGFNLNLGCPSPHILRLGAGCALIKRVTKVKKLVQMIRDAGYPVSIKMRLGMNKFEKEKKVYLNLINEVDADFFIVHGRHGKEREKNPNDFSIYEECVKTGKVIIANGDIRFKEQIKFLKSIGVRGAMIGQAAVDNPEIFKNLKTVQS